MNTHRFIGFLLPAILLAAPLEATLLEVSVSGTWNASAPVSLWTGPNKDWAFRFLVDSHPAVTGGFFWDTGFNPPYSDFIYTLNGAQVATAPAALAFNSYATLAVVFQFGPTTGFQLFGPQAFSGPTSAPTILTGTFLAAAQPNTVVPYFDNGFGFFQDLTGTPIRISQISQVPEPSTLLTVPAGMLLVLVGHRRSRLGCIARKGESGKLLRNAKQEIP